VAEGSERHTDLPAFSESIPVAVGTAVWAVLAVIGLVIRPELTDHGRGWWVWTAVAGTVLGCFGYWFVQRRQRHLRAPAQLETDQADSAPIHEQNRHEQNRAESA
jgi:ABC-type nickel/cobalt efflux system permease component RcnA